MTGQVTGRSSANRFVSHGVAHVDTPRRDEPVLVNFVLVPKFTMLALTSAIEPLRAANQLSGSNLFEWQIFSENGEAVVASNGVVIIPDGALPQQSAPGYVFVCGGVEPESTSSPVIADWLRAQWRHGHTVGSLCSGAYVLAEAGILKGRKFTLHWENIPGFREAYPDLDPVERSYCIDNRLITCAGGIAAAEIALRLINDHCGAELGQAAMNMCLLTHRRTAEDPQVISIAARLGTRNEYLVRAVEFIEAHVDEEFNLAECAAYSGVTLRQIQRLFRQYLGITPMDYRNNTRLRKARIFLSETNMSVMDVALACGYSSSSHFAKAFRKKYGVSPSKFSNFG
ncbi:GlxA family transcriptional regulator [Paracoccus onubensis]|uniref:GlxA family transcriptional regulator n=1 Tax=Paracoccus onubensis TaxID=1675788 RepID=A0A418T834_9RHOB|nr:GlxA family transcriptional regulator [Paracoccus onubensis]RJE89260.1 GlxA family transcriptional regulator [Paracoccus onubensis]